MPLEPPARLRLLLRAGLYLLTAAGLAAAALSFLTACKHGGRY